MKRVTSRSDKARRRAFHMCTFVFYATYKLHSCHIHIYTSPSHSRALVLSRVNYLEKKCTTSINPCTAK